MGLGSTAKRLQELADTAEKLFRQLNDLRKRVAGLEEDLQTTADRVSAIEAEQTRQRALLEAVAEAEGVDVETVLAAAETEPDAGGAGNEGTGDGQTGTDDRSADG